MTLTVSAISKRLKNNWVLRDISFAFEAGSVMGVCGPTGCGKSTLLKVLAGKEKSNGGSFELNDLDMWSENGRTLYLTDTYGQKSWFGFSPQPRKNKIDSVYAAIESNSEIVLLDEPFCGVDNFQKAETFLRIQNAAAEKGKYVILATADFADVLLACDQVVLIDKGEMLQSGTPEEVYSEPISSRAATLTGRNNLFEARRLTSTKAELPEFQTITGSHRLVSGKTEKSRLGALNQNIKLGIRPEHVSISFGASFPEDNLLKATIVGVRFLGPTTIVECDANGLLVEALVSRLVGLSPGDECLLGMPPDRISVYAA